MTKIAHMANPPSVIHTVHTIDQITTSIKAPETDANSITSEVSVSSEITQHQLTGSHVVLTVHYKHPLSRETQNLRHTPIQKEGSNHKAHSWQEEVQLSDKYSAYNDDFTGMFTKVEAT